jgi:hypothetical protein
MDDASMGSGWIRAGAVVLRQPEQNRRRERSLREESRSRARRQSERERDEEDQLEYSVTEDSARSDDDAASSHCAVDPAKLNSRLEEWMLERRERCSWGLAGGTCVAAKVQEKDRDMADALIITCRVRARVGFESGVRAGWVSSGS